MLSKRRRRTWSGLEMPHLFASRLNGSLPGGPFALRGFIAPQSAASARTLPSAGGRFHDSGFDRNAGQLPQAEPEAPRQSVGSIALLNLSPHAPPYIVPKRHRRHRYGNAAWELKEIKNGVGSVPYSPRSAFRSA